MLQKVCHSLAPRSFEASSSCRLKPTRRDRTTTATKGKQKETWAMTMFDRLSGHGMLTTAFIMPVFTKNISKATPMQISGMTMGSAMKPS